MRNVLLLLIALLLTSCGPGQLFSPTLTLTPTNTPTPTSTSTPTPTITLTPTPTPLPYFVGLPTEADLPSLPVVPWGAIPAVVARARAEPSPFSPDAPAVVFKFAGGANQLKYSVRCVMGVENCLIYGAFRLENGGIVLLLRIKTSAATPDIMLLYAGGAADDFKTMENVERTIEYIADRSSSTPSGMYHGYVVYTNNTSSIGGYGASLITRDAGAIMEEAIVTGRIAPEDQVTIFAMQTPIK